MFFAGNVFAEDALKLADELVQLIRRKLGIGLHTCDEALLGECVLEEIAVDAHDDIREHLDEAAIGIPYEMRVAGLSDEPFGGCVREAEVQNRVHHARHGERRAGTHRDKERILWVAQALAHARLEVARRLLNLGQRALGPDVSRTRILHAGLAGDGVASGHRQADAAHLCEVRTLATERIVHARGTFGDVRPARVAAKPIHALRIAHDTPPSDGLCP